MRPPPRLCCGCVHGWRRGWMAGLFGTCGTLHYHGMLLRHRRTTGRERRIGGFDLIWNNGPILPERNSEYSSLLGTRTRRANRAVSTLRGKCRRVSRARSRCHCDLPVCVRLRQVPTLIRG